MGISFYCWDRVAGQEVTPHVRRKAIAGEGLMLLRVEIEPGGCEAVTTNRAPLLLEVWMIDRKEKQS